jgi:ABC-type glycerol-3-phosphate transport system permease component
MELRQKLLLYGALGIVALVLMFPFYWVMISSD